MLNRDKLFFNIGTAGSMPREVLQYFEQANLACAQELLNGYGNQTAAQYETLFQAAIDAARAEGLNVRALMWSSPTFLTGTMLPIRRLVNVAINNGLISICDGAHLPGRMARNCAERDVDIFFNTAANLAVEMADGR